MKKKCLIYFLSIAALVATSCTSDQYSDISLPETDASSQEAKSAADKVFKMECIVTDYSERYITGRNEVCTDALGNFYFLTKDESSPNLNILVNKYDITTGQTSVFFELGNLSHPVDCNLQSICIDNEQNLYYADLFYIYKISLNEGSIVNLTSRFPDNPYFSGLCVADNGNVFVSNNGSVYKITAQGNVTQVNEGMFSYGIGMMGGSIFKPKGAFVYGSSYSYNWSEQRTSVSLIKANTTNGTVETYSDYRIPIQSLTAATNNNNPYALSGNTIMELRPNVAKDLLVGTIPDYIINKDGSLKKLGQPTWIVANADATVFYLYISGYDIYKLTLE